MRPRKKDTNHNAIASELQSLGCWVTDTSAMGNGFPDMLVHNFAGNNTFFVEAKSKYGKRNELQIKFADSCPLPVYEIHSTEEARDLIIHSKYEPRW
jgi:hypothetical protein